jgi:hypothetical protein
MLERYIPETFFEEFCEFIGISGVAPSAYKDEVYRGFWKQSIVIFTRFRQDWLEVHCTRESLRDEFSAITKKFHTFLENDAEDEKISGQSE